MSEFSICMDACLFFFLNTSLVQGLFQVSGCSMTLLREMFGTLHVCVVATVSRY